MTEIYFNSNSILLTIAIPTYNGSKTICTMLDILLPQYDSRVEILISDNCSTDDTLNIIEEYRKKYTYIRYVRNDRNIGPDANFLQCMKLATGRFTLLLSDDDILIENGLSNILNFLQNHPDISLAYLDTVGFRGRYTDFQHCIDTAPKLDTNICTSNKILFMAYAAKYWGFMSSFVFSTNNFRKIDNPEQYFGTYWLQSYIHILCSAQKDAKLGLIKRPAIAGGQYVNVANFDTALIDGIYYRKMLDYAVEIAGYDKKQLEQLYCWRICLLGRQAIIKEKAAGVKKTNIQLLIKSTWRYPSAWISLYPFLLIPEFVCRLAVILYRKNKKLSGDIRVNRPE